jgi:ankyrin repeat protein
VKAVLDAKADINAKGPGATTALHSAAAFGDVKILTLLLENRARIDWQDEDGHSPLHSACAGNHLEAIKLLLAAKACPFAVDARGLYPLNLISVPQTGKLLTAVVRKLSMKEETLARRHATKPVEKGEAPRALSAAELEARDAVLDVGSFAEGNLDAKGVVLPNAVLADALIKNDLLEVKPLGIEAGEKDIHEPISQVFRKGVAVESIYARKKRLYDVLRRFTVCGLLQVSRVPGAFSFFSVEGFNTFISLRRASAGQCYAEFQLGTAGDMSVGVATSDFSWPTPETGIFYHGKGYKF